MSKEIGVGLSVISAGDMKDSEVRNEEDKTFTITGYIFFLSHFLIVK